MASTEAPRGAASETRAPGPWLPLPDLWRASWLPAVALAALSVAVAFTPAQDNSPGVDTPLEKLAHHLGHEINSIWVGLGLILLVVPSILEARRPDARRRGEWAWRALEAVLLDLIVVDALGKGLLRSMGRPGLPDHPGFPSGHATFGFLMAWLIWKRFPKLGPLWFAMAALIAWSRVEVLAHFPYQVLGGALFGTLLGALETGRSAGVLLPCLLLSKASLRAWRDAPDAPRQNSSAA